MQDAIKVTQTALTAYAKLWLSNGDHLKIVVQQGRMQECSMYMNAGRCPYSYLDLAAW